MNKSVSLTLLANSITVIGQILSQCKKKTYRIWRQGGIRSEKYLANLFCDILASICINVIYVSFVIIYNQETGKKNCSAGHRAIPVRIGSVSGIAGH